MATVQLDESTVQIFGAVAVSNTEGRCTVQKATLTLADLPQSLRKKVGDAIVSHAAQEAASES